MLFDLLWEDGEDLTSQPFGVRRRRLEALGLEGPAWMTPEMFSDGKALFEAVCELGLKGIVAKRLDQICGPAQSSLHVSSRRKCTGCSERVS